ncbi:N-acetylmuramoyl-L-alanine amidase [Clostridium sp. SYSU_GA19001]|uniref:N-acetylmuramoyl-L-alanine amidase family protein n=1 Tax=Clostridium caldaquaticum TaxID=2940653 RepID=UPI002077807F|nr:N-acetylmuramoyl-L-alanine amidase [Clostridium caldaquaticum]MCM8711828.1 N-acetylmuramoyl-L-alanine amidase [Clostridium caldaquaticum]
MRVRVANKRRFTISCCVFALIIFNFIFAVSKRLSGTKDITVGIELTKSSVVLAADKSGSISLEENEYFKRYVINTRNYIDNVETEEYKEFINIHLSKSDIAKLSLRGENNQEVKDVFYDNSKGNLIIKFKKSFSENNFVYIDKSNKKKIIVLLSKKENPFHHSIALDAGHGGEDKGANVGNIFEKDITLKIANYAEEELRFKGFKVIKTRDEDRLVPLSEIGKIANEASADLFVSVHNNFNTDSIYKGISTYYYAPNGYQQKERIRFAETIQKELVKNDNWEDRGIISENFQVLRETKMPSVLLELGFLSNPQDRNKLTKDEVLKNFAVNIANGVDNYLAEDKNKTE